MLASFNIPLHSGVFSDDSLQRLACFYKLTERSSFNAWHQNTSSSAIAERPRCRVGQCWPKVEDDTLQTM